jgi:hypothetical protein
LIVPAFYCGWWVVSFSQFSNPKNWKKRRISRPFLIFLSTNKKQKQITK